MRVRYQAGTRPVARASAVDAIAQPHRPVPARRTAAKCRRIPALSLTAAVLLTAAGCATPDLARKSAWRIDPVQDVQHSALAAHGHYAVGRYHDGMRAWDKAARAYQRAVAADPRHAEAYNALGVALARLGRHDEAELALHRAVALEPREAHVRSNLGFAMLLAGRLHEALVELKAAVRLDPNNPIALGNLRDAVNRREASRADESNPLAAAPLPIGGAKAKTTPAQAVAPAGAVNGTAPAGAASLPGKNEKAALPMSMAQGALTVAAAMPITVASVPAPLARPVYVAAPLMATPMPPNWNMHVFDAPTVSAWPLAVAANVQLQQTRAPAEATPVKVAIAPAVDRPMRAAPDEVVAAPAGSARVLVELSNGNGVRGMAARLGQWLQARNGVQATRLTNQPSFAQEHTRVEYGPGQEEAAWRVMQALPLSPRDAPVLRHDLKTDVRVVLGGDWRISASCLGDNACWPAGVVTARSGSAP